MDKYKIGAYAQEGEDLVLKEIFNYFERRKPRDGGFYVDVGALHPYKISNTALFYERNWHGINIDATPESMSLFSEFRPRDINLQYAVSDKCEELTFYIFENPALNSFDRDLSFARSQEVINEKRITTVTLEYVLDKYLPEGQVIDFLNVDVEGLDFKVIKSNNWEKYRPKVVLVEMLSMDIKDVFQSNVYQYLIAKGYLYLSKTVRTHFFVCEELWSNRYTSK